MGSGWKYVLRTYTYGEKKNKGGLRSSISFNLKEREKKDNLW